MPEVFEMPLPTEDVDWGEIGKFVGLYTKLRDEQERSEEAARRFAAEQEYERLLEEGTDPLEALRSVAPKLYQRSPAGLAALMRQPPEAKPALRSVNGGLVQVYPDGTVIPIVEGKPKMDVEDRLQLHDLNRDIAQAEQEARNLRELAPDWSLDDMEKYRNAFSKVESLKKERARLVSPFTRDTKDDVPSPQNLLSPVLQPPLPAATNQVEAARTLTRQLAKQFLQQAGGDKEKARALARAAGYDF